MKHLEDVEMSYFQHLFFAWKCAGALLIHGLLPWFFEDYASKVLTAHPKVDKPEKPLRRFVGTPISTEMGVYINNPLMDEKGKEEQ